MAAPEMPANVGAFCPKYEPLKPTYPVNFAFSKSAFPVNLAPRKYAFPVNYENPKKA